MMCADFRLHRGSSWEMIGVPPGLSAWSKAGACLHPRHDMFCAAHTEADIEAVLLASEAGYAAIKR